MSAPFSVSCDPVRLDNRLSPMARIFYAEVCGNVTVNHGAIVNDNYYAKLFDVSERQVRTWRKELIEYGYTLEKIDTNIGMKCIFPTKTVEEKILAMQGLKKPKVLNIAYRTPEGKILRNASEAKVHYEAKINASYISEENKSKLFLFINTFLQCIYDDTYFNKIYANQKVTKEFFQFVLNCLTIDEIYSKALFIFSKEKNNDIRQLDYYIITVIVNAYKDEFNSKIAHKNKQIKRKEMKKL